MNKTHRPITHPESKIQAAIVQLLQAHRIFCHSVPNERKSSPQAMGRLISMGLRSGVADLIVWWPAPSGVSIGYLEVKAPGGRLSEKQKHFQERCQAQGVRYDVAWSVDDVQELISRYVW